MNDPLGDEALDLAIGHELHGWMGDLFPLCRSITGNGVRDTLKYLKRHVPELQLHEVPTGTQVFDWTIPDEWNIADAYIADLDGHRLVDFRASNLHVVSYSEPVDAVLTREQLEPHLYSLPDEPSAIPYVTSYYRRTWGFCVSHAQRQSLGPGPFHVKIDATLEPGSLTYADAVLPGDTDDEILISSYVCHPSLANNELSGPVVITALGRWIRQLPRRRYTYRLVYAPETIGSITYLSRHLDHLKRHVKAGWVVTCVGDDREYSYLPSRFGDTLADRVAKQVLADVAGDYHAYSFLDRGSDERQWCSPGADLPVCSVMRSKYGTYPEYHSSLDDLSLVSPNGLAGGYAVMQRCVELIEANARWRMVMPCEPQLGKRGLYPTTSIRANETEQLLNLLNVVAYCDGSGDVVDLCRNTGARSDQVIDIISTLAEAGVVERLGS
ncbi:MAG: DUF4910 domain-containing protein [Acidimicrobiia bacterium]